MTERLANTAESYICRLTDQTKKELKLVQACVSPADQARVCPWVIIDTFANDVLGWLSPVLAAHELGALNKIQPATRVFWQAFSQYATEFNGLLPTNARAGILKFIGRNCRKVSALLTGDKRYYQQAPQIVQEVVMDLRNFQQFCGITDEEVEFSNNILREIHHLKGVADQATGGQLPAAVLREKFMTVFQQGRGLFDWRILPQKRYPVPDLKKMPPWIDQEGAERLVAFLASVPLADKFSHNSSPQNDKARSLAASDWFSKLSGPDNDMKEIAKDLYQQNPLRVNILAAALIGICSSGRCCQNNDQPEKANSILAKNDQLEKSFWTPLPYQQMSLEEKFHFVQEVKQTVAETLAMVAQS